MSAARSILRSLPFVAAPLVVALAMPACTTTVEPAPAATIVPTEPNGTLVVDWTIELRKDPTDCRLAAADAIQIHVFFQGGADAGTYQQDCGVFATSIVLQPGSYSASAELITNAGQVRSTSVAIQPFSILGGDTLHIPIDFPADSFF